MVKPKRAVYTRGGAAEEPNWRFSIAADIPRSDVPELCDGLGFIAREKRGGSYFYPDYKNGRMAVACEWYLPYRNWPMGYKVGVEFWVDDGSLRQMGAYVLYGPDHPRRGLEPAFRKSEQASFQRRIIQTVESAVHWRNNLQARQFFTVHYLEMPNGIIRETVAIPPLGAYILPTVRMGKENRPVSAVVQAVEARFEEEAKSVGGLGAVRLCALLTLATGSYYEGYRSTLGRTPLKQSVSGISPMPALPSVYPKGKFKMPLDDAQELGLKGPLLVSRCYTSLHDRSAFDKSLFAYYAAEDLTRKRFPTVAAVALIAALSPFRGASKCEGTVSCGLCGKLKIRHDRRGEASTIGASLADMFGLPQADERRSKLEKTIMEVYSRQRSSFVHDAIFGHGEFGPRNPFILPSQTSAISEKLVKHNQLLTIQFLTRRALLQHLHRMAGETFDPSVFGIEPERFESPLGSTGSFHVSNKYPTGIRVMGRF